MGRDRRDDRSQLECPSRHSLERTSEGAGDVSSGRQEPSIAARAHCLRDKRRIETGPGPRDCDPAKERLYTEPSLFSLRDSEDARAR